MRKSAGILLFRIHPEPLEVFLVHPGGPFWKNKEKGAWSIPKGEFTENELPLEAAKREFHEETGQLVYGPFIELEPVRQKSGKMVFAWAVKGDIDAATIVSNSYKMQWPPGSGTWQSYPEVDKAGWFDISKARILINPAQENFIDDLLEKLDGS
ncbi:MAG: NUDIX domain-containing protein [Flavisolibacter sp.]